MPHGTRHRSGVSDQPYGLRLSVPADHRSQRSTRRIVNPMSVPRSRTLPFGAPHTATLRRSWHAIPRLAPGSNRFDEQRGLRRGVDTVLGGELATEIVIHGDGAGAVALAVEHREHFAKHALVERRELHCPAGPLRRGGRLGLGLQPLREAPGRAGREGAKAGALLLEPLLETAGVADEEARQQVAAVQLQRTGQSAGLGRLLEGHGVTPEDTRVETKLLVPAREQPLAQTSPKQMHGLSQRAAGVILIESGP